MLSSSSPCNDLQRTITAFCFLAQQPRMFTDSDCETHVVSVGQVYFKTTDDEETELVPAYTPSYSSIDGRTISFSNLGPSHEEASNLFFKFAPWALIQIGVLRHNVAH